MGMREDFEKAMYIAECAGAAVPGIRGFGEDRHDRDEVVAQVIACLKHPEEALHAELFEEARAYLYQGGDVGQGD